MIEAQSLRVGLGGKLVVRDVSLTAARAAWFGLLGVNGSGKTTLLRALAGRLPVDGGRMMLDGADVTADRARRSRDIGFAAAPDSLPGDLRGDELIALLAQARGTSANQPAAIRQALGVATLEGRFIEKMSAGMRQRLALFCAFLGQPKVVLLDEPFNWLDPVVAHDFKRALKAWVADGGCLVTALHDVPTFALNCDAGLLLHDGRVLTPLDGGRAKDLAEIEALEARVYAAFKTQPN